MSETERNEAIGVLKELSKSNEWQQENKTDPGMNIWALALAISALRAQSEAERRIEAVKSTCLLQDPQLVGEEGYEWPDGCTAGRVALSEEILEILEGKDE